MNPRITVAVLVSLVSSTPMLSLKAQTKENPPTEQSHFDLEQPVTRPVNLPENVLKILRWDPIVLGSRCQEENRPSGQVSASWFEASAVHLDGQGEIDLLVKAKDPCLFGVNIGPFWVFRQSKQNYVLVLSVNAIGVEMLKSTMHLHHDLMAGAIVGGKVVNVIYRFDGRKYQEYRTEVEETK